MKKVENGFSNMPNMASRPFKKCPECAVPLAGGETQCYTCAQRNKGVTPDASIKPMELPAPRPNLEGGK